ARLLLAITLQPQEGRTQMPAGRERLREGAVEVDADQEARVLRYYLRGGGPGSTCARRPSWSSTKRLSAARIGVMSAMLAPKTDAPAAAPTTRPSARTDTADS